MTPGLVAIGTSAGGVSALQTILQGLPADFALTIAVVHHLPSKAQIDFGMAFRRFSELQIQEVEDKAPLEPKTIFFAPPGYHLLVEKSGVFSLSVDEPVHHSRPSIDVFFNSVAHAYSERSIGVLLTGANNDGAEGLRDIQDMGGYTIVQNPETAEIATMPASALQIMRPNEVLHLDQIAASLVRKAQEWTNG